EFADRFGKPENARLLLFLAPQLTQVRTAFHHLFIADVHRYENDGFTVISQEAAHGHGEHARPWWQHAPGTGPATFDNVLHGVTPGEHDVHGFVERRGIQGTVPEPATHEEGPAPAQNRAHNRHVQVDARCDVRRHQAVFVEHVTQQQVINV